MANFEEKWGEMTDDERLDFVLEIQKLQSGSDKKVSELQTQIDTLKAEAEKAGKEKVDSSLAELQAEAAAVAAQKALNEQTANMLQRGVEEKIDPKLAVQFATLADPDGAFDRALAEINRRASEKVDEIISQAGAPESSPSKPTMLDLSQFSQAEISRMPKEMVERYMEQEVMK